jgi:hypothetical protein
LLSGTAAPGLVMPTPSLCRAKALVRDSGSWRMAGRGRLGHPRRGVVAEVATAEPWLGQRLITGTLMAYAVPNPAKHQHHFGGSVYTWH